MQFCGKREITIIFLINIEKLSGFFCFVCFFFCFFFFWGGGIISFFKCRVKLYSMHNEFENECSF